MNWYQGTDKTNPSTELPEFMNTSSILLRNVNITKTEVHYWCEGVSSQGKGINRCQMDVQCEWSGVISSKCVHLQS